MCQLGLFGPKLLPGPLLLFLLTYCSDILVKIHKFHTFKKGTYECWLQNSGHLGLNNVLRRVCFACNFFSDNQGNNFHTDTLFFLFFCRDDDDDAIFEEFRSGIGAYYFCQQKSIPHNMFHMNLSITISLDMPVGTHACFNAIMW